MGILNFGPAGLLCILSNRLRRRPTTEFGKNLSRPKLIVHFRGSIVDPGRAT